MPTGPPQAGPLKAHTVCADTLEVGSDINLLAGEFERDMLAGIKRCKEFGYNPTYWLRMVMDHRGVGAAKRLLVGRATSEGFARLWEEGRLDLSVEYFALLPKYEPLFERAERDEARRRLEAHGFDVLDALGPAAA
jgi:hypothetical protein